MQLKKHWQSANLQSIFALKKGLLKPLGAFTINFNSTKTFHFARKCSLVQKKNQMTIAWAPQVATT